MGGPEQSVMTVKDLQFVLKLSKNMAYRLINSGAFPVKRVGRVYRIPVDTFQVWLHQCGKSYGPSKQENASNLSVTIVDPSSILGRIMNGG